jgi:hypothetical protein
MCPFFVIMRPWGRGLQHSCSLYIYKYLFIYLVLLRMWISWLARWKTQYEHVRSTRGWLWLGCLLTSLPYFLLFALSCNLMLNILSVAHSYCFLKCLYVVSGNANWSWQLLTNVKPKNIWRKSVFWPTYPTFFRIWNLNHIFFVMFKIDQKNAAQLETLKFDWHFFQLHFDSRHLPYR